MNCILGKNHFVDVCALVLLGSHKIRLLFDDGCSGPETARLLKQFEEEYPPDDDPQIPKNFQHHEQALSTQKSLQRQVTSVSETIRRMGNPFFDDFPDLVTRQSNLRRRNRGSRSAHLGGYRQETVPVIRQECA